MISRQLLLMTVLCLFMNVINAGVAVGNSRSGFAMSGARSSSSSSGAVRLSSGSLAASGGNAAGAGGGSNGGSNGGGNGGDGAGKPNANTGELNVVQDALNNYEQQIGGKNPRKKVGVDSNGNKIVCETMRGGGGPTSLEGIGPQEMAKKKEICIMDALKKKQIANAVVKQAQNAKECTIKVNKRSMICHTKKVIQDMIESPVYEIKVNGNVVTVFKKGEAILATVVEIMNYNVIREEPTKKEKLEKPVIDLKFNELGGLLSQEGEMPSSNSKTENPCAECMQQLTNKANTMEGTVDDCNYSCDSNMITSFLKPSHFKEIKTEEAPKGNDSEGGGAEGNAVAH